MRLTKKCEHLWAKRNFSLCMNPASPQSWVFQGHADGTLLYWINMITVVLACYRDATCMGGLCTDGTENIQLASKPHGCLQKKPQNNNQFIARECSAWRFPPSPYLLALLLKLQIFRFLIVPFCFGVLCFGWVTVAIGESTGHAGDNRSTQASVFSPAGRHRFVFLD